MYIYFLTPLHTGDDGGGSDSDTGGSSTGAIVGGVIGGIIAVVVIAVFITVVCYFVMRKGKFHSRHTYVRTCMNKFENVTVIGYAIYIAMYTDTHLY